jgi:hypothetical protein
VDLLAPDWLTSGPGRWLALWIAGFWIVRTASQLYFGRRWGDWAILMWFATLSCLHLVAAVA